MIRNLGLLGTLAVVAGCASQSPAVDSTPAAAATSAAAAPRAAAPVATAQASAPVATVEGPPPGWQVKKRANQTVYCKKVDVTGSMFPQEVCLPPEQLEAVLRAQKTQAQRTLDIPRTTNTQ